MNLPKQRGPDPAVAPRLSEGLLRAPWWAWICLALVLAGAAAIRIRLLAMPLERDEGEYAYFGQLLLSGVPPYKIAYSMKLPGVYIINALILAVFGQTPSAIRLGLLLANAATVVLVFLLGRRLWGPLAGVAAGAVFALLSVSGSVLGVAAHATHFVTLFAIAGLLALLVAEDRGRAPWFFGSGVLLGCATLMKQPGVVFTAFAFAWLAARQWRRKEAPWKQRAARCAWLAAGAAAPLALTVVWLVLAGAFDKFWYWTVRYAAVYGAEASLRDGWAAFAFVVADLRSSSPAIWILAAVSLVAMLWVRTRAPQTIFAVGLLVFSFLGVCPDLFFRAHYFILFLPAAALIVGWGVQWGAEACSRARWGRSIAALPVLLLLGAVAQSLWADRGLFFLYSPQEAVRALYGSNPFPEAVIIGRYISEHSRPDDEVFVLGSEPEIYFYARRRAAAGYIYMYPLVENQPLAREMQQELIREVENNRPAFLVYVTEQLSWLRQSGSPELIFDWLEPFASQNYDIVGRVDLDRRVASPFIWDPKEAASPDRPGPFAVIARRRDATGGGREQRRQ